MSARGLMVSRRGSIADVLYPKGATIVCRGCGKPLYVLTASIYADDRAGDSTRKYRPVTPADLQAIVERFDVEPGHRAVVKTIADWPAHCAAIQPLRKDSWDDCPSCHEPFAFGSIAADETSDTRFGDKGFVIALACIPPQGSARRVRP